MSDELEQGKAAQPAKRFRVGYVTAAVWANDTHYSVTLQKAYKDGDQWKNTESLGHGDLLNAAKALERAEIFIAAHPK
ncbi:hypothetical protein [Rhodopseudomonas palustris]|uniref:hypothetical protein n=1 Tax=Rhodopseudomonas palustris TaxID=1076 RepID=UPI000D1B18CA|nr:hypothetical protein [Rhodopseudomonas palustris]AVT83686.1 hypothetical protein RPYSC3_48260 [Rhodopseudomonas palustris]